MEGSCRLTPRLRAVLEELPVLVLVLHGQELIVAVANPRRADLPPGSELVGLPAEQMLDRALASPQDRARCLAALRRVMQTGETVHALESPLGLAGDGGTSHWDVVLIALRAQAGAAPDGVVVHAVDVTRLVAGRRRAEAELDFELTERKQVEHEAQALLARTRRLQEITASVSASNSAAEISRAVIHHALEELGASAGILVRGEGDLRVEHAIGFDTAQVEQWRAFPATLPGALLVASGVPGPGDPLFPGGTLVAVPLLSAEGSSLGAMAFAYREPRELAPGDTEFLAALARQLGAALDRARLYENRAYVASKLQEGLLPERLAGVPGLEAAVVYESIAGGGEVGGDFYDLFEAAEGRWVVAVGDVCGKGTDAAVITGLARHTVRAVAHMQASPAEMLGFLNGALRRHATVPSFCTVGCGVISRHEDGGFRVCVASGGHPFPLVLLADGALEEVEVTGTMLGVAELPELVEVTLHLAPGDALVVYTDGVTDARRRGGERFGEDRLFAAVRAAAGGTAEEIAGAVEAAVRAHHPGHSADDRALVVLRAEPPPRL